MNQALNLSIQLPTTPENRGVGVANDNASDTSNQEFAQELERQFNQQKESQELTREAKPAAKPATSEAKEPMSDEVAERKGQATDHQDTKQKLNYEHGQQPSSESDEAAMKGQTASDNALNKESKDSQSRASELLQLLNKAQQLLPEDGESNTSSDEVTTELATKGENKATTETEASKGKTKFDNVPVKNIIDQPPATQESSDEGFDAEAAAKLSKHVHDAINNRQSKNSPEAVVKAPVEGKVDSDGSDTRAKNEIEHSAKRSKTVGEPTNWEHGAKNRGEASNKLVNVAEATQPDETATVDGETLANEQVKVSSATQDKGISVKNLSQAERTVAGENVTVGANESEQTIDEQTINEGDLAKSINAQVSSKNNETEATSTAKPIKIDAVNNESASPRQVQVTANNVKNNVTNELDTSENHIEHKDVVSSATHKLQQEQSTNSTPRQDNDRAITGAVAAQETKERQINVATKQAVETKTDRESVQALDESELVIEEQKMVAESDMKSASQVTNTIPRGEVGTRIDSSHTQVQSSQYQQYQQSGDDIERLTKQAQAQTNAVSQNQAINGSDKLAPSIININDKNFADKVKEKVMIMVSQRLQSVDIQLDPPELGNVHVRVNLQGEQAMVNFVVQQQNTKDALEQHMGKLKDMLEESGIDLGQSDVQQDTGSQEEALADNAEGRHGRGDNGATVEEQNTQNNAQVVNVQSIGVDYFA